MGVKTHCSEEPYVNSTSTVLWEGPGVTQAPTRRYEVLCLTPIVTGVALPLRKRNRLAAMRTVQSVALDLFEAQSFEEVTVEDIAEAAGVSPSTVYRHFGTKERLVLWDELDERIDTALAAHLGKAEPYASLCRAFVEAHEGLSPAELKLLRRRMQLIDRVDILGAHMAGALEQGRIDLQRALAKVHRRKPDDLKLELTARIALAALLTGLERWQKQGPRSSLPGHLASAFKAARRALD